MTLIKVSKKDNDKQLKNFLLEKFGSIFSSSKISKAIKDGDIKINGKKSVWNSILKENDEIKIFLKIRNENFDFLESKNELDVIYEDTNILIVNKPRGVVCQKDAKEKKDTLNQRIKKYLYNKNEESFNEANLVHRLDKYTFGLCVAGKNLETIKLLNDLWNTNCVSKYYRCFVFGCPKQKQATLKAFIMYNEQSQKMEIDKNDKFKKEIITSYKVVNEFKNYTELEVKIDTGKKHQIRVHLSSIGHPILGDSKYNNINLLGYKFPTLCSYKIVFNFDKNVFLSYLNQKTFVLKKYSFK